MSQELDLSVLVRDAVARHRATKAAPVSLDAAARRDHASHALYLRLPNGTEACLIEPAVECTHCGYCQSHGH